MKNSCPELPSSSKYHPAKKQVQLLSIILAIALCMTALSITTEISSAQDIQFDPTGLAVRIEPLYSFQGNTGQFIASQGGSGTPTASTTISPTDAARLNNGNYLVNTLGGTIQLIDRDGDFIDTVLTPAETGTTFIDPIRFGATAFELHPDFNNEGTFGFGKAYQIVTQDPRRVTGITPDFLPPETTATSSFAFQNVVREYDFSALQRGEVTSYVGNAPPTRDLLRYDQAGSSHSIFDLEFNARGDLFITVGDGGFTELGSVSFPGRVRQQAAQNLNDISGSVLRINPDVNAPHAGRLGGNNNQYSIPGDNPFFDSTTDPTFDLNTNTFSNNDGTLDEIFANGVRSPFRLEADFRTDPSGNTLVLSDVGDSQEEVTRFTARANLGHGLFEGNNGPITTRFVQNQNQTFNITSEGDTPQSPDFTFGRRRTLQFNNDGLLSTFNPEAGGQAISGGVVYNGSALGSDFEGLYVGAELGSFNGGDNNLSRLIIGDFDNPGTFTVLNIDPAGQQFAAPLLEADAFAPGFDFTQPGIDFDGQGNRLLPELILGVFADELTGELLLFGTDSTGNNTISRIVPTTDNAVPGDVDGNNAVNADDFFIIRDNFNTSGAVRGDGDLNSDGFVDLNDFAIWRNNTSSTTLASLGFAVPEPSSLSLLSLALLIGLQRRR